MNRLSPAALILVIALIATACGGDSSSSEGSTTETTASGADNTAACPIDVEDECDDASGGQATVTLDATTYVFQTTRCIVGEEAFLVDAVADNGSTLMIRHASPPPRDPPEPSMSYLLIEPEPQYESFPAGVGFGEYDVETGVATGWADPGAGFSVRCGG